MFGLGQYAQLPQLAVQILHKFADARFDRAEIVVFKLLTLGCGGAQNGPARIHQVLALFVYLSVYKEIFLLGSHGGVHVFRVLAEKAENAQRLAVYRSH